MFALIAIDQSPLSIAVFALVFGATFLMTAPLTVLFVRDHFGMRHLGALTGLITMVHQIFGGIGAYGGALIFDRDRQLRRGVRDNGSRVGARTGTHLDADAEPSNLGPGRCD